MTVRPDQPDQGPTPEARPAGGAAQAGLAVAVLAEAWLRDSVYCAVGIFSLVVAVCGFGAADGAAYAVLGLVAALVAVAIPTVAVVRKARASRIWLALLAAAAVDTAALAIILAG
jgi:hypothetical protein